MKRTLFVLILSIVGSAVGGITFLLLTAFIPMCGEDCSREKLVYLALCFLGCVLFFLAFSIIFTRHSIPTLKQSLLGCTVLGSIILVPTAAHYVYELHSEYLRFKSIAPIQPTTDFYHMAISTRVVQGFTDASYGPVKPLTKIPRWERCLIGAVRCKSTPRQVEVLCKSGVVHINEPDWSAFALIPQENSQGVAPLKSTQLCNNK